MSNIEWTQQTWNPIAGCSKVSAGCANCYAEVMAGRLERMGQAKYQGLTVLQGKHARWTGKIAFDVDALLAPLRRKKPTTYFVNSMSDLFHENVTDGQIDQVFAVMALCQQHTFQVLTKRPERMLGYFNRPDRDGYSKIITNPCAWFVWKELTKMQAGAKRPIPSSAFNWAEYAEVDTVEGWPLPNVWLGVSVENQESANERIPRLLKTPAAVRLLSCEPLLNRVELDDLVLHQSVGEWHFSCLENDVDVADDPDFNGASIDWVIVGGESGYGSRECNVEWIRAIVQQCAAAGVPCFVKQLGMKPYVGKPGNRLKQLDRKKGGWMDSWPEDLRVRQMPEVSR